MTTDSRNFKHVRRRFKIAFWVMAIAGCAGFANCEIVWGSATNGVRAGLQLPNGGLVDTSTHLTTWLTADQTDSSKEPEFRKFWLVPAESAYELTLLDSEGKVVTKRKRHSAPRRPLSKPLSVADGINFSAGYKGCILFPGQCARSPYEFTIDDVFTIPHNATGKFKLRYDLRVVWIPEKGFKGTTRSTNLPLVDFPPVILVCCLTNTIK